MVTKVINSAQDIWSRFLHSPFAFQIVALGLCLFFILSFRPAIRGGDFLTIPISLETVQNFPLAEPGFLRNLSRVDTSGREEVIIVDEETGEEIVTSQPKRRTETIVYTVKSGDNLSKIAHKFGLKVSTLLWANGLTAKQTISVGQDMKVPPVDGVFYTVQKGDTITDIAKRHNVDTTKIYAYNSMQPDSVLRVKNEIFIPDAKKVFIAPRVITRGGTKPAMTTTSGSVGSIGFTLSQPAKGIITQGYNRNHYALDIANRLNTHIYASAGGTVIKSKDGWNYGYGKYVIVDHGNGVETLYAHMNDRKVSVGDEVREGQLLGLMGNTGNVFGPTGIHLHFELRIRGRKVNPMNYF